MQVCLTRKTYTENTQSMSSYQDYSVQPTFSLQILQISQETKSRNAYGNSTTSSSKNSTGLNRPVICSFLFQVYLNCFWSTYLRSSLCFRQSNKDKYTSFRQIFLKYTFAKNQDLNEKYILHVVETDSSKAQISEIT